VPSVRSRWRLTTALVAAAALAGCGGSTGSTSTTTTGSLPCGSPAVSAGQPRNVVILLDGVGSQEDGGTYYPLPINSPQSGVPVVQSYCPLDASYHERDTPDLPSGLASSIRRWSEFKVAGGSSGGSSAPDTTQACDRPGGFGNGDCLTEALADAGAVLLPYSYTGATLNADGSFAQQSYSSGDSKQAICTSVSHLAGEVSSVHQRWPQAGIVLVGHSYGGLVAETWWYDEHQQGGGQCGVATNPSGVTHVFSLDSPINGVRACSKAGLYAGDASKTWCTLWGGDSDHGVTNGKAIAAIDDHELSFTAVGTPNDPTYGGGVTAGGGGLHSQLVYDCTDSADENDPSSSCIDRTGGALPVSYPSLTSQCDGSSGNVDGTTGHDIVKVCPPVVKLIVSALQSAPPPAPPSPATPPSPPATHACTLAHGAEGGGPLAYTAKGLSCEQALPVLEAAMKSAGTCTTSCTVEGFACRLLTPLPVQPGSRFSCVLDAQEVDFELPG